MYDELSRLALTEFADIITHAETWRRRAAVPLKLRLTVRDGTLIDVCSVPTWLATLTIGSSAPNAASSIATTTPRITPMLLPSPSTFTTAVRTLSKRVIFPMS